MNDKHKKVLKCSVTCKTYQAAEIYRFCKFVLHKLAGHTCVTPIYHRNNVLCTGLCISHNFSCFASCHGDIV